MAKILWSKYFIEAQGYKNVQNKRLKCNKRAILLEKMSNSTAPNGLNK